MKTFSKAILSLSILFTIQAIAQDGEQTEKSNIQTYTPSKLLDKGQWDIKFFLSNCLPIFYLSAEVSVMSLHSTNVGKLSRLSLSPSQDTIYLLQLTIFLMLCNVSINN